VSRTAPGARRGRPRMRASGFRSWIEPAAGAADRNQKEHVGGSDCPLHGPGNHGLDGRPHRSLRRWSKYHYAFWRPVTAIGNGDIDGNPATAPVATWQPISITPLHPEYPCAHCIITGAEAGAIAAILGTDEVPEVALTSPWCGRPTMSALAMLLRRLAVSIKQPGPKRDRLVTYPQF
jgi:hypothetical protein